MSRKLKYNGSYLWHEEREAIEDLLEFMEAAADFFASPYWEVSALNDWAKKYKEKHQ